MSYVTLCKKWTAFFIWVFVSQTALKAGAALNVTADRDDYATWPSMAVTNDGTQWVAWQEYNTTQDANKLWARPVIGGVPGQAISLTAQWGQYLAAKVAIDGQGRVWFVWPGKENGNWDLWACYYDGNTLSDPIRVTDGVKPEFHPALAIDQSGRLWIAYEDFNGAKITIRAKVRDGDSWGPTYDMSHVDANGYSPDIAVDDAGRIWVVWYSFRASSYDVYARYIESGSLSEIKRISQTVGFDEYPVVAPASQGGVWIAWRNGQMAGGRIDLYGFTWYKVIFMRRVDNTSVTPVIQVPTTDLMIDSQIHGPTPFALRRAGNKNLLYVRQPDTASLGSEAYKWAIRGLVFDGSKWSQAFGMSAASMGYHQPMGVALSADGTTVSVAWQTDDRVTGDLFNAHSDIWIDSQLVDQLGACTRDSLSPRANSDWPHYDMHIGPRRTLNYRGTDYNVYFGDLHCHTDNSLDAQSRNGMYDTNLRRVRDLTHLDFICLTDHGFYMNYHDWNEERKWIDIYNQLDDFTAFEGWEWTQIPSVTPEGYGHRNVIFRGSGNMFYSRDDVILPTELWSLLTVGEAITIPHHPASSVHPMDWDYHDPDFACLVEIFQIRGNHEYHDAPRVGPDSIQPGPGEPEPPEYVHPALARGLRFGLIASPDHQGYSGEAAVLAPACNRDDLMNGMLARRAYAVSNSKFFCDFRVDGYLMGEEYMPVGGPVEIYVHLIAGPGFGSIYKVDIFRIDKGGLVGNDAIINIRNMNASEVEFTHMDSSPPQVDCAYYVRALQEGTNSSRPEMVWSSPVFALFGSVPEYVSVDLDDTDLENGMSRPDPEPADGNTIPTTIGGKNCRRNDDPGGSPSDRYIYFKVNDDFVSQGSRPELFIMIDYYDTGSGSLVLQYDGASGVYTNGGSIGLTATDTWKQHTYHITDAYFGNRQNQGADFRIDKTGGSYMYLDIVRVANQLLITPIIAEVTPDPDIVVVGTEYVKQLVLEQGFPTPSWSVVQGPAEMEVGDYGLVAGWTPDVDDLGSEITVEIEAGNVIGSDTESWIVVVVSKADFDQDGDVDQEDFGHFQACYCGPGAGYPAGCEAADLDPDGDIDLSDFAVFQACMGGANKLPAC